MGLKYLNVMKSQWQTVSKLPQPASLEREPLEITQLNLSSEMQSDFHHQLSAVFILFCLWVFSFFFISSYILANALVFKAVYILK